MTKTMKKTMTKTKGDKEHLLKTAEEQVGIIKGRTDSEAESR